MTKSFCIIWLCLSLLTLFAIAQFNLFSVLVHYTTIYSICVLVYGLFNYKNIPLLTFNIVISIVSCYSITRLVESLVIIAPLNYLCLGMLLFIMLFSNLYHAIRCVADQQLKNHLN